MNNEEISGTYNCAIISKTQRVNNDGNPMVKLKLKNKKTDKEFEAYLMRSTLEDIPEENDIVGYKIKVFPQKSGKTFYQLLEIIKKPGSRNVLPVETPVETPVEKTTETPKTAPVQETEEIAKEKSEGLLIQKAMNKPRDIIFNYCMEALLKIEDGVLAELVLDVYNEMKEKLVDDNYTLYNTYNIVRILSNIVLDDKLPLYQSILSKDVLIAGAMLCDVGMVVDPDRHVACAIEICKKAMEVETEETKKLMELIRTHHENNPDKMSEEAKLLQSTINFWWTINKVDRKKNEKVA